MICSVILETTEVNESQQVVLDDQVSATVPVLSAVSQGLSWGQSSF